MVQTYKRYKLRLSKEWFYAIVHFTKLHQKNFPKLKVFNFRNILDNFHIDCRFLIFIKSESLPKMWFFFIFLFGFYSREMNYSYARSRRAIDNIAPLQIFILDQNRISKNQIKWSWDFTNRELEYLHTYLIIMQNLVYIIKLNCIKFNIKSNGALYLYIHSDQIFNIKLNWHYICIPTVTRIFDVQSIPLSIAVNNPTL